MKFKEEVELFARGLINKGMDSINFGNRKQKREGFTKITIGRQLKAIIKKHTENG